MQPKPSLASNLQADGGKVLLEDQSSSIAAHHCKLHMGVTHSETRSGWERQSRDGTATRGWVTPMRGSVPFLAKRGTTPFCVPNNSVTLPQHDPVSGTEQALRELCSPRAQVWLWESLWCIPLWHWPARAISPPTAYQQHGPSYTGPKGLCCPLCCPQFCPVQYSMLKTPLFMPCTGFRLPLALISLPLVHPSSSLRHV